MAPSSVASSAGNFPQEYSTFTSSKLARDGASWSSSFHLNVQEDYRQQQVETPIAKQSKPFVQLRASAEKYNPKAKLRPQRSPAVPEAELNTSKLAHAFPGFSGIAEEAKPFSPNPFVTKANGHKLKMLSQAQELHPRVRDENDISIVGETHSSPVNLGNKNTRFGIIHVPKIRQGPQPHKYKSAPGLVQKAAAVNFAGEPKPMAINAQGSLTSIPNGSTQPTLNLPHATNLTDLFSGVVRHPPPCTAQKTIRPRASRFASAAKNQTAAEPKADEIPVPIDERHLLESIDMLQNRVTELETEKKELTTRRRSDSAVSIPDDASNDGKGQTAAHHRVATEKLRLETVVRALEGQKDLLLQDVDVAETAVGNITQERDLYQSQLFATETEIHHLQAEKHAIGQQRDQTIEQLAVADFKVETLSQDNKALLEENQKLKAQIALLTQTSAAKKDFSLQHSSFDPTNTDTNEEGPIDMDTISMMNQQRTNEHHLEQVKAPEMPVQYNTHSLESSHNITHLSYGGDSSVCEVRKTLEQERKARQQRRQEDATRNANVNRIDDQNDAGAKASNDQTRGYSESSVIKRPKCSSLPRDDLTSGYIVPDITFNQKGIMGSQASLQLPADTRPHSEVGQQNVAQDCTERSDILSYAPVQAIEQPIQQDAESRQLPPICDAELNITIHDEEPTIRPSQPADVALATVMESLKAEHAAQRAEMAKYQASYDRHDVSISRRQRNRIVEKIQALLASTNIKADQIYNLQDVLEGHKQHGQPLTQHQIDDTLQSLGLDLPWEGLDSRRRNTASSGSI